MNIPQRQALTAVARGYPHHEPVFTLFFLAADFLPDVQAHTTRRVGREADPGIAAGEAAP
jgi:hypothetical protein